jgi:ArsR family transcriptional regulator
MTPTAPTKPSASGKRASAGSTEKKEQKPAAAPGLDEITSSILRRSTADAYIEVFRALSEQTRIEILSLIASCDDEYPCTQLEKVLPVTKSTISYHIKILSSAGLVKVRKEGRYDHSRVRRNVLDFFLPGFLEHLADDRDD